MILENFLSNLTTFSRKLTFFSSNIAQVLKLKFLAKSLFFYSLKIKS